MTIQCEFENGNKAQLRHTISGAVLLNGNGDKVFLVLRSPDMKTEPGKWTLPAGYMDLNETSVEAVLREIMEETGYQSEALGVVCIDDRPTRPDNGRQNVGIIFAAVAGEKTGIPDKEQTDGKWFLIDELPVPMAFHFEKAVWHFQKNGAIPLSALFLS